jgi:hypothetical protein
MKVDDFSDHQEYAACLPTPYTTFGYISNTCPMIFLIGISSGGGVGLHYSGKGVLPCGQGWQYWQWADCDVPAFPLKHVLQYGYAGPTNDVATPPGVLNGVDLLSIDQKIDDGKPQTGNVQTMRGWPPSASSIVQMPNPCLTNATDYATAAYDAVDASAMNRGCPIIFFLSF